MPAVKSRVGEARKKAVAALEKAYGRSEATPDGMYCLIGRIDRAYDIVAANGNQPKHLRAVEDMATDAQATFAEAERLLLAYRRVCKREGATDDLEMPVCDCPSCKRVPTFGGR